MCYEGSLSSSDLVAFLSGLLLGGDTKARNWFSSFVRIGQKVWKPNKNVFETGFNHSFSCFFFLFAATHVEKESSTFKFFSILYKLLLFFKMFLLFCYEINFYLFVFLWLQPSLLLKMF